MTTSSNKPKNQNPNGLHDLGQISIKNLENIAGLPEFIGPPRRVWKFEQ